MFFCKITPIGTDDRDHGFPCLLVESYAFNTDAELCSFSGKIFGVDPEMSHILQGDFSYIQTS